MKYSTKEEVLAEFNKGRTEEPLMTMEKLRAIIKGHVMSGAGRYIKFNFLDFKEGLKEVFYEIKREDVPPEFFNRESE